MSNAPHSTWPAPRAAPQKTQRAKRRRKPCTCIDTGGFAEHLPMDAWREVMAAQRRCARHGASN